MDIHFIIPVIYSLSTLYPYFDTAWPRKSKRCLPTAKCDWEAFSYRQRITSYLINKRVVWSLLDLNDAYDNEVAVDKVKLVKRHKQKPYHSNLPFLIHWCNWQMVCILMCRTWSVLATCRIINHMMVPLYQHNYLEHCAYLIYDQMFCSVRRGGVWDIFLLLT